MGDHLLPGAAERLLPPVPRNLPQLLFQNSSSTQSNSTNSTESFQTQILRPLPYHMSASDIAAAARSPLALSPFGTPDISQRPAFETPPAGLNPISAPYVPPPSSYPQAYQLQSLTQQPFQPAQQGQVANPYGAPAMTQFAEAQPDPYAHYSLQAGVGAMNPQVPQYQNGSYGQQYPPYQPMQGATIHESPLQPAHFQGIPMQGMQYQTPIQPAPFQGPPMQAPSFQGSQFHGGQLQPAPMTFQQQHGHILGHRARPSYVGSAIAERSPVRGGFGAPPAYQQNSYGNYGSYNSNQQQGYGQPAQYQTLQARSGNQNQPGLYQQGMQGAQGPPKYAKPYEVNRSKPPAAMHNNFHTRDHHGGQGHRNFSHPIQSVPFTFPAKPPSVQPPSAASYKSRSQISGHDDARASIHSSASRQSEDQYINHSGTSRNSHNSFAAENAAGASRFVHRARGSLVDSSGMGAGNYQQPDEPRTAQKVRGPFDQIGSNSKTITPTMHSNRSYDMGSAIKSRKEIQKTPLATWLEGVEESPKTKKIDGPPKMASLLAVGGININEQGEVGEIDPFITSGGPPLHDNLRQRRSLHAPAPTFNNPFAPVHQLDTPYNQKLLIGPVQGPSNALRAITDNLQRRPFVEEALKAVTSAFVENCRLASDDNEHGVIRITNIPYGVNRSEVLAFLGRNARLANEAEHEPVHIVMERVTSKTLDCFVEFANFNEAVAAVQRFEHNRIGGKGGRLGQRHVEVELSSQSALMRELFPKAKNVDWDGSRPVIKPRDPEDIYNSGFQGFISREELVMLVKHVEVPGRSPFSKDCPQRPYECLISTLYKYPWYMVDHITIGDRDWIFYSTIRLLRILRERVEQNHDDLRITPMLYKRLWRAAVKCKGFNPNQKDDVMFYGGIDFNTGYEVGVPKFADYMQNLWTIAPMPGCPDDLWLYFAAIMREHLEDLEQQQLTLAQRAAKAGKKEFRYIWGNVHRYCGNFKAPDPRFYSMTLAEVAQGEWAAIEAVLRMALGSPTAMLPAPLN